MKLLTSETFFVLVGIVLIVIGARTAADRTHPRRWGSSAFWALLGVTFAFGSKLPALATGYLLIVIIGLAANGQVKRGRAPTTTRGERAASAARLGNRIFGPALLIPLTTLLGSLFLAQIHLGAFWLIEPRQRTFVALGVAAVVSFGAALRVTGARLGEAVAEGDRLIQALGWAIVLPQLLAALGGVFAKAGVGEVVAGLARQVLPTQYPGVAVVSYCLGMALFTICMGNAFAAFAVVTAGLGLPLIVLQHHGDPAIMAALGMLSGYCGTLLTPMAANFNLVPVMLLDLPDRHAVIRAQAPVALLVLAANIALMWSCVYRF
jgi:uncharacterized membrane protein